MEKLMIRGGRPLRGTVQISGAKNSAVALIARSNTWQNRQLLWITCRI